MLISDISAPSLDALRPLKLATTATFPVYRNLTGMLLDATTHPQERIAHVLATCSGYAYAKAETVAMIMARMGLVGNRCQMIAQYVDAMFICSTSFLIRSADARVAILAYRGTEPTNAINWLTDADVHPDKVAIALAAGDSTYAVHEGFYRNVRATRYELITALEEAREGGLEALYITGHSLGGAMAALMAVMLVTEPAYAPIADKLRAVYTFGQPMIGSPELARACDADPFLGANVVRYVYQHDVVTHLPPGDSGPFAHFGQEYRFEGGRWQRREHPAGQMPTVLNVLPSGLTFVTRQLDRLPAVPFRYSLDDHAPQHYVSRLVPPNTPNEFGDYQLAD